MIISNGANSKIKPEYTNIVVAGAVIKIKGEKCITKKHTELMIVISFEDVNMPECQSP